MLVLNICILVENNRYMFTLNTQIEEKGIQMIIPRNSLILSITCNFDLLFYTQSHIRKKQAQTEPIHKYTNKHIHSMRTQTYVCTSVTDIYGEIGPYVDTNIPIKT